MFIPDSNLLLYAYNSAAPEHKAARAWWEACLSGAETVGLAHRVVFSFVRIGTNPHAFTTPLTLGEAAEHVQSWIDRSVTRVLCEPPDQIEQLIALLQSDGSAGGNLVTDAQIAAIANSHNAIIHTADHYFMRFAGVKCHFPLDAAWAE